MLEHGCLQPCEGLNSVMEDTVDSMVRADLLRTPPQVKSCASNSLCVDHYQLCDQLDDLYQSVYRVLP